MTAGDKIPLLKLLTESHSAIRATIEEIDPEGRVYTDTSWRIRYIIGHIATWDRRLAKSLRAFQSGSEYSITNLEEHAFNVQAVKAQQALTA
jgi:hypothetical protein